MADLHTESAAGLRSRMFIDQTVAASPLEDLVLVRNEIGRRMTDLVEDLTPCGRTLSAREIDLLALAAEVLSAGRVITVVAT